MPTCSKSSGENQLWLWSLVTVILAARIVSGSAQAGLALASLTVPEKSLPNGCRLEPVVPPEVTAARGRMTRVPMREFASRFPRNPWSGTDHRLVVTLRTRIDGAQQLPDAPPPTAAERSAMEQRWVSNVVEGYRAAYVSERDGAVEVSALRFDDARLATTTPLAGLLRASRGISDRVVLGAVVVRVEAGSRTGCFQAVDTYIRSLK